MRAVITVVGKDMVGIVATVATECAATNANIKDHRREAEEREIFERLWPKSIAGLLMIAYKKSYKAYDFGGSK